MNPLTYTRWFYDLSLPVFLLLADVLTVSWVLGR